MRPYARGVQQKDASTRGKGAEGHATAGGCTRTLTFVPLPSLLVLLLPRALCSPHPRR